MQVTPSHVSTLSSRVLPYLPGYRFYPLFPVTFRFGSIRFLRESFPTEELVRLTASLLQSQYIATVFADHIGVYTFHKSEIRLGWVLPILRGQGVCTPTLGNWLSYLPCTFWSECISLFHSLGDDEA